MKRSVLLACVACVMVAVAIPGTSASGGTAAEPNRVPAVVLTPDLENGVFRSARITHPEIVVVDVVDLRGGDPAQLGATSRSLVSSRDVPLMCSMPVADFVRRSLVQLLGEARGAVTPVRVRLGIEQFDLGYWRTLGSANGADFQARLAVSAVSDTGFTSLGWIQATHREPKGFSLDNTQRAALYKGTVALAQGFGDGQIDWNRARATPVVATGDPAHTPVAPRRSTVTSTYRTRLELDSRTYPMTRVSYLGLTAGGMKDAYDDPVAVGVGSVMWMLTARSGIECEIAYASEMGKPRVIDPSWTVRSRKLELYALPLTATYLHRLTGHGGSPDFAPYVGLGAGLISGVERMKLRADRFGGAESFEGHLAALRFAGEGHAVLGADFHVLESAHGLVEARWVQAGKGSTAEFVNDKNAEDVAASRVLHSVVRRSTFDFSGWRVSMGFRWDIQ